MSEEKKKIELTEDQLEKIAAGDSTAIDGSTKCPQCGKNAYCLIILPEWIITDIMCFECHYGMPN